MMKKILLYAILAIILTSTAVLALEIPENLQLVKQQEQEQANFYLQNITFIIAFIAGILSIFSPCILPTLPAFFAYTFKEKRKITRMTLAFFLGFAAVFVALGLFTSFLGISFASFQQNFSIIVLIAGILLVVFGIMSIFGKGMPSLFHVRSKTNYSASGIFLFGIAFALGWSACLGPILFGILSMAAVLGSYAYAGLLLFIYALGIFVPLFIIAFFYDRYNLSQSRFIRGKEFIFNVRKRQLRIHSTGLIAGILLLFLGLVFIFYQGTGIVNTVDIFGTRQLFYDVQHLLFSDGLANAIGLVVLVLFIVLLWKFLRRDKTQRYDTFKNVSTK